MHLTCPLQPSVCCAQGYLALTLLLHENSDLIRLIINSIRKDLDDHSEINNCLALHAIANIGGKEMAESLAPDVHRLLISPVSIPFVKKKAALTLLRLYRKHPSVIPLAEWGERIVTIMDDDNLVRFPVRLRAVLRRSLTFTLRSAPPSGRCPRRDELSDDDGPGQPAGDGVLLPDRSRAIANGPSSFLISFQYSD